MARGHQLTNQMGATLVSEKKDTVDSTSIRYDLMAMQGEWELIAALTGGTQAMRKAGTKYLPRQEAESESAYQNRLKGSFLLEAFNDTIEKLTDKPFVKPITIQDEDKLDKRLQGMKDNVDKTGRDLTQLSREMLDDAIRHGKTHILVDFPRVPEGATLADERALKVRPVFIHVKCKSLIAWREDDNKELTEIRYKEETVVPDGQFRDKVVHRIRVIRKNNWEVWELRKPEENQAAKYMRIEAGEHTFNAVPLVTFYTNQTGQLTAKPPMLKLAWLNLSHWQSASDQRNLLNTARVPILFGAGFTDDEVEDALIVSTRNIVHSRNEEAKLKYVEHEGKALSAGREDLQDLENQMVVVGAEPLVQRPGDITATEVAVGEKRSQSSLQAWIRSLENALAQAYQFAAKWLKVELPADFKIDIFNDFGITVKTKDDIDSLLKMRQAKEISQETFLREIKRRGLLSESLEIEEEIDRIEEEGPSLGLISDADDEGDDDVDDPDDEDPDEE